MFPIFGVLLAFFPLSLVLFAIGPILISMFFLMVKIYHAEYKAQD